MNESINDEGVCRTSPATPGLLEIAFIWGVLPNFFKGFMSLRQPFFIHIKNIKTFNLLSPSVLNLDITQNISVIYPILDTRISVRACVSACSVTLRVPPLDSKMGLTGELWSKTNLLNWQN